MRYHKVIVFDKKCFVQEIKYTIVSMHHYLYKADAKYRKLFDTNEDEGIEELIKRGYRSMVDPDRIYEIDVFIGNKCHRIYTEYDFYQVLPRELGLDLKKLIHMSTDIDGEEDKPFCWQFGILLEDNDFYRFATDALTQLKLKEIRSGGKFNAEDELTSIVYKMFEKEDVEHAVVVLNGKCVTEDIDDTSADSLAVMIYEYSLSGIA